MSVLSVYVIDDDDSARDSMAWLLQSAGYSVHGYRSAIDFLRRTDSSDAGCVIVDYRMPGMTGLEMFEQLKRAGRDIPTILVTAYGDLDICTRAFRGGAIDFLEKPVQGEALLAQVARAMAQMSKRQSVEQRFATLSGREQEALWLLVEGQSLKQVAATLGISVQTAAKHRARVLEKMHVQNDVELSHCVRILPSFPNERLAGSCADRHEATRHAAE